jgi:hypothetical protein
MNYDVFMITMNFLIHLLHGGKVVWIQNDTPHARHPKTATSQQMVEKVKNLIATDARLTTKYIHCIDKGSHVT